MKFRFVLLASLLLCFMGFYNGFPLVYPDTGSYMEMGFNNHFLLDRPMTYGLFLRHISLHESLWLVIFVQSFLLAWSVNFVFKYFSQTRNYTAYYLLFFLSIVLFTGASVNASQLIPDIFTSILILNFIVIVFAHEVSKRDLVLCSILFVLSLMMHNSHLPIVLLFLTVAITIHLVRKWKSKNAGLNGLKYLYAIGLTILAWLSLSTLHYTMGGRFTTSGGSHVFMVNRLLEIGILEEYLDKECDNKNYKICAYKDQIPEDFLWDYANSPLHKTGDWETNREEYNQIIGDVLTRPRYLKLFILRSIEASIRQFFAFDTGDTPKMVEGSPPYGTIHWFFRPLLRQYMASKQSRGELDFGLINQVQRILILTSLLLILLLLYAGKLPKDTRTLMMVILGLVFCNACICATFGGVFDRFQSRVIWLVLLPVFVTFTNHSVFQKIKEIRQSNHT